MPQGVVTLRQSSFRRSVLLSYLVFDVTLDKRKSSVTSQLHLPISSCFLFAFSGEIYQLLYSFHANCISLTSRFTFIFSCIFSICGTVCAMSEMYFIFFFSILLYFSHFSNSVKKTSLLITRVRLS